MNDCVVIDGHGICVVADQQPRQAVAPGGRQIVEQVVAYDDVLRLFARIEVVTPENVDAARHVADDVVGERDGIDRRPVCTTILVPHGEQHRVTGLRVGPAVLHQVAVNDNVPWRS